MGDTYRVERYPDDCRDGHDLLIARDDQGDVYVSVVREGNKIGPTVRLCASGGADHVPGLLTAMYAAHKALADWRRYQARLMVPGAAPPDEDDAP